jgi:uncharacterized membrane protein YkvA (DUF1232 family)
MGGKTSKNRIFAALRRENASDSSPRSVRKATDFVDRHYIAYKRKDVPVIAKIIILAAIIYGLPPIDLMPDFIPPWVIWTI